MAAPSDTFSGARAIFLIDGSPIGFAGGVSGEETIDYEPVDVLNLLRVLEHVPVAYRVSMNAQIFRVINQSIKQQGIMPARNGEDLNIINKADLTAAIQDKVTNETAQLFLGVRCSGHTFDVTARGIVSENVSFVALETMDEFENKA